MYNLYAERASYIIGTNKDMQYKRVMLSVRVSHIFDMGKDMQYMSRKVLHGNNPGDFVTKVKQINSQSDFIWMSSHLTSQSDPLSTSY